MRLYANKLAWLKVECPLRGRLSFGYDPGLPRPFAASPKRACQVIKPSHRGSHSDPRLTQVKIHGIDKSADKAPETDVPRSIILDILAQVPPFQGFCVLHLSRLAHKGRVLTLVPSCLRAHSVPDSRFRACGG